MFSFLRDFYKTNEDFKNIKIPLSKSDEHIILKTTKQAKKNDHLKIKIILLRN